MGVTPQILPPEGRAIAWKEARGCVDREECDVLVCTGAVAFLSARKSSNIHRLPRSTQVWSSKSSSPYSELVMLYFIVSRACTVRFTNRVRLRECRSAAHAGNLALFFCITFV